MKYKAFISYSHSEDRKFAPYLQKSLETFSKKWYQIRHFRIFRDETNLAVAPDLWKEIEFALGGSEYFLYLASPKAAKSKWIKKEINWWLRNKNKDNLLILLTDGNIFWNEKEKKFDKYITTSLPDNLSNVYETIPFHIDFRTVKNTKNFSKSNDYEYIKHVANISARLLNKDKDELIGYNATEANKRLLFLQLTGFSLLSLLITTLIFLLLFMEKSDVLDKKLSESQHNLGLSYLEKAIKNQKIKNFNEMAYYSNQALKKLKKNTKPVSKAISMLNSHPIYPIQFHGEHKNDISTINFSDDGKIIASGAIDSSIKLWNAETGEHIETFVGHGGAKKKDIKKLEMGIPIIGQTIKNIVFPKDENIVISTAEDLNVIFWDLIDKNNSYALLGDKNTSNVVISPDGEKIAFIKTNKAEIIDSSTGKLISKLDSHLDPFSIGTFSPSGKKIVLIDDNSIKIWNFLNKKEVTILKRDNDEIIESIAFSQNEKNIALASNNVINVWDISTEERTITLRGHTDIINSVHFSKDDNVIISASRDKTVKLWNINRGNYFANIEITDAYVEDAILSPDSRRLAIASKNKLIVLDTNDNKKILNLENYSGEFSLLPPPFSMSKVLFFPNSYTLISSSEKNNIKLWNTISGEKLSSVRGKKTYNYSNSVVFSTVDNTIIHSADDGSIKKRDAYTLEHITTLVKPNDNYEINSMAISKNHKLLAAGYSNGELKIWDISTKSLIFTFNAHKNFITDISFSPDNHTIVASSIDQHISIWSLKTGELIKKIKAHDDKVMGISFSPSGSTMASGSYDGSVKIWNTFTWKESFSLNKNEPVMSVRFSPNGELLAIGHWNGYIRIWDTKKYDVIAEYKDYEQKNSSLAFSDDGNKLAVSSIFSIKVFDISDILTYANQKLWKKRVLFSSSLSERPH